MTDVARSISNLITRCEAAKGHVAGTQRRSRITLYAIGIKQKLLQAENALDEVKTLVSAAERSDSTLPSVLGTDLQKIEYHNDCFWSFFYSAFEILAQVINQTEQYNIDEQNATFYGITTRALAQQPSSALSLRLDSIRKSHFYKRLKKYRHCSNHRRPICVSHDTHQHVVSEAYANSSSSVEVRVLLCDDAYDVHPKFSQEREIIDFCTHSLEKGRNEIAKALDKLVL